MAKTEVTRRQFLAAIDRLTFVPAERRWRSTESGVLWAASLLSPEGAIIADQYAGGAPLDHKTDAFYVGA